MIGLSATVIIWLIYNAAVTWLIVLLWRSLDDFFSPFTQFIDCYIINLVVDSESGS